MYLPESGVWGDLRPEEHRGMTMGKVSTPGLGFVGEYGAEGAFGACFLRAVGLPAGFLCFPVFLGFPWLCCCSVLS